MTQAYGTNLSSNPGGTLQQLNDPQGTLYSLGGTTLQGTDPNSLVTNQLATLLRSDNPIVGQARNQAVNYALARGGGVDSGASAYLAEEGALASMTPLAQQNAQQIAAENQANQSALNTTAANRLQAETESGIAQTNRASAMDQLRAQQQFQQQQALQNRQWAVADQGTQAEAAARSQFFGNAEQAIFSDPSFWQDPQGAMGMFNEYGSNFDSIFNDLFPEYGQDIAAAGQPTGNTTGGTP